MASVSYVQFSTTLGTFVVQLYNQVAPQTVANFLSYVNNPTTGDNYTNNFFHRLVQGFVLQGGGYDLQGNSIATIPTSAAVPGEYNAADPNVAGTIAMALSTGPNSATDQFFINLADNSSLLDNTADGGPFTVFGKIVENYSVVQTIAGLSVVNASSLNPAFNDLPVQGTVSSTGLAASNLVEYSISVVQPFTGTQANQPVLDDATVAPFSTVALTDPGNTTGANDSATITVETSSGSATGALGTLSLPSAASSTGVSLSTSGNGVYTLSTAASLAALQSALQQVVFTPTALSGTTSAATADFDVLLNSPGGALDDQTTSVVVTHDTAITDTITGADGVTRTLSFGTGALATLAAPLLAGIVAANALFVDNAGAVTMTGGQNAAIDDAAGPITISGGSTANETIAAGAGALSFAAGAGSGTVVAGGGADSVLLPNGGAWLTALGNGADTVVAATGNDTVDTGNAGNFVFLGAGTSSVASSGTDTILGGTGSATIHATGGNKDEVFSLGAPLQFIAGTGASTVVSGTQFTQLVGGAGGGMLAFSDGSTFYSGAGATDTVVGLNGSLTVAGGAGGGLFFGGTAGNNAITAGSGNTTAVGGGAGDVLTATGSASVLFAGGTGAETLTGAASTGSNTFFAGFGPETLIGGSGSTALVAGPAADLLTGGAGLTLFLFTAGRTAGASDTIWGWNAAHDFVKLAGYSGSEATTVANATHSNGSSTIALSDGTHITFAGVAQLSASSFT